MSKKHTNSGIGPDNWLYIASHALSLFREEGGSLVIRPNEGGLLIELSGILPGDSRLNEGFRELVNSAIREELHLEDFLGIEEV